MAGTAEDPEPRVGDRRPDGRRARVRTAVLAATLTELAASSYEELRIEDVAARCRRQQDHRVPAMAHKGRVGRRGCARQQRAQGPDTRQRLARRRPAPVARGRAVAANIGAEPGRRMTRNLIAAAGSSAEAPASMVAFWSERLGLARSIVDRAIARGELDEDVDPNLVIETLDGALYVGLLMTGEPITPAVADTVASMVHGGVARLGSDAA